MRLSGTALALGDAGWLGAAPEAHAARKQTKDKTQAIPRIIGLLRGAFARREMQASEPGWTCEG